LLKIISVNILNNPLTANKYDKTHNIRTKIEFRLLRVRSYGQLFG